jgi:hypothetical protein
MGAKHGGYPNNLRKLYIFLKGKYSDEYSERRKKRDNGG